MDLCEKGDVVGDGDRCFDAFQDVFECGSDGSNNGSFFLACDITELLKLLEGISHELLSDNEWILIRHRGWLGLWRVNIFLSQFPVGVEVYDRSGGSEGFLTLMLSSIGKTEDKPRGWCRALGSFVVLAPLTYSAYSFFLAQDVNAYLAKQYKSISKAA